MWWPCLFAGSLLVHMCVTGRLAILCAISGDILSSMEPPGLSGYKRHVGVFIGQRGNFMASAHDRTLVVWRINNKLASVQATLQSHQADLIKVCMLAAVLGVLQQASARQAALKCLRRLDLMYVI